MSERYAGFAEFVAARGPALARSAFLLTADRHAAEDLLQSALAKAAARWGRLREPEAYVRRILYTEQVSRWRRTRSEVPVAEVPAVATSSDEESTVARLTLLDALARLPRGQRAVVVLRFYDDLTEAQAAAVLGVSVGTVKSQTHAALARLRTLLPDVSFSHDAAETR